MPAITYRNRGEHIPVVSASAALTGGTLAQQEGFWGIVITGVAIGKSTVLDAHGVHRIAVPSGVLKGDRLYANFPINGDTYPVTLTETATSGYTLVGIALGDRDADGFALVKLAHQPAVPTP